MLLRPQKEFIFFFVLVIFVRPLRGEKGTLASCEKDSDCAGARSCFALRLAAGQLLAFACTVSADCHCVPNSRQFTVCTSSADCQEHDRCYDLLLSDGVIEFSQNYCAACSGVEDLIGIDVTERPIGDDDGNCPVCIAASMLQGFHPHELVYASHIQALVLCDANASCATPSHVVTYRNVPMMMKTYCALDGVQCSRRMAAVNNPRIKKALRVPSRTSGLEFTSFAARYGTLLEERVIGALVRFGL